MTTFHLNELPKEKRIQMIGEFYDMFDSLKDRDEVRLFLKSLLSADEIANLMRRIEIAVLLQAHFSYEKIIELLGAGRAKISAVHKNLLQDDSGYKIIAERLIKNRKERLRRMKREERDAMNQSALKRFSPGHYFLSSLVDAAIEKLEEDEKELEKEALLYTPSSAFLRNEDKNKK